MKQIFLYFSLMSASLMGSAQVYTQTVRGTVKDKESQLLLSDATISILSTNPVITANSDAQGVFKISNVPIGRHTLKVSRVGYRDAAIPDVILTSAKEAVINIELEELVNKLSDFTIKSKANPTKTNNEMVSVSGRLFTADQTNRFAGSLGDPSRMAANFAGVGGVGGQRNDIVIRGNSPSGLLWRLEGVDIPNPNHFSSQGTTGGPISILNNNTLASSDFITGAFPAEYGNALGGVFDLKMRNGNNEKREFTGQIGFNGLEFMAEGPINKKKGSSYMASYRYSTLDFFDKIGINLTFGGVPKYQDLTFKFNFPKTKTGQWQIAGIGGKSNIALLDALKDTADLSFNQNYRNNIYNGTDMGVLLVSNLSRLSKTSYIKTVGAITYQRRFTEADSLTAAPENREVKRYGENTVNKKLYIHSFYHVKINARNSFRAGAIVSFLKSDINDSVLTDAQVMRALRSYKGDDQLLQAYLEWKYNISSTLTLNSGLMAQHWTLNGTQTLEPRVGMRWNLMPRHTLSIGSGMHSQLQPMEIYYAKTPIDNTYTKYIQTNTQLGFSKSIHGVLGYDFQFNKDMRIKIETYYQHLYNIPVDGYKPSIFSLVNFGADFAGLPAVDSLKNNGTGKNYGVEFTFEKFFSKGYYWLLTASLFDSKYTPSNKREYNSAFNGNYVVNALAGYEWKLGRKKQNILSINLKATMAGGRRYIPIDEALSKLQNKAVYDDSRAYEEHFKAYFRPDVRIGFKLNGKRVTQEWAIDIQNASNTLNPLQQSWDPQKKQMRIEYQQGVLPIVLYRIQF
jgi:hypothetical protein